MTKILPFAFALALSFAAGCGGGSDDGGAPITCTAGSAIAIGATGADPACLRVAPSTTVTISNGRAVALEVRSNPHPTHGSCPEIDATAAIPAGGSVDVVMTTVGTCRFHDHATGTPLGIVQVGSGSPGPDPY